MSLDALQSVCTDTKASPPPSDAEFSSASSVIALALDDQVTANYSYSVHAGERTTIAGTTITSGSVVRTVVRKYALLSLLPLPALIFDPLGFRRPWLKTIPTCASQFLIQEPTNSECNSRR